MKVRTGFRIFVAFIVLAVIGGAFYLFSGRYNVAADEQHWAMTRWFLATVRNQSIEARIGDIDVPDLSGEQRIRNGAVHYDAMCAGCHLKPGRKNSEIRQGLNPKPPSLVEHAEEPAEAFWVTKHGIRMTGMPAWGETHGDRDIWDIVAFTQRLPELSVEEYENLTRTASQENGHAHSHDGAGHGGDATSQQGGEPTESETIDDEHDHSGHEH